MYIYKIENQLNHKVYIGLTTKTVEERWTQHCQSTIHHYDDYLIHKAMRKDGIQNFKVEIIDTAENVLELCQKEIEYIAQYHSCILDPDCQGYNMTFGGDINLHLKGEQSPCSKNTDEQRYQVISLLQNTTLTFKDIAQQTGLNSIDGEKLVSMINTGENFYQPSLNYPLRKNTKSVSKQGEKNPSADIDKVQEILDLLINTNLSQQEIADRVKVHLNTVNNINTCKYWTELHDFKYNIREELKTKVKTKQQQRCEQLALTIIADLEQQMKNTDICKKENCGPAIVSEINNCHKYTYLHNYKQNIRKESRW